jgi:hypothetical protein
MAGMEQYRKKDQILFSPPCSLLTAIGGENLESSLPFAIWEHGALDRSII